MEEYMLLLEKRVNLLLKDSEELTKKKNEIFLLNKTIDALNQEKENKAKEHSKNIDIYYNHGEKGARLLKEYNKYKNYFDSMDQLSFEFALKVIKKEDQ